MFEKGVQRLFESASFENDESSRKEQNKFKKKKVIELKNAFFKIIIFVYQAVPATVSETGRSARNHGRQFAAFAEGALGFILNR